MTFNLKSKTASTGAALFSRPAVSLLTSAVLLALSGLPNGAYAHGNGGPALVAGDLDPSFGTANDGTPDGVVSLSLGAGDDFGNAVAIQRDGKIVVVGTSSQGGSSNIEVYRLNRDGSVDTAFGTANDGTPDGIVNIDLGPGNDMGTSVAIQEDGKIVVAGDHEVDGSFDMVVARLNRDGSFDTGFGTASDGTPDGVVDFSLGAGNDYANAVALQHDGKIVVVGSSNLAGSSNIEALRLNRDGSVDVAFGTASDGTPDGVVNIDLGPGNDIGTSVAIQEHGQIVLAGNHEVEGSSDMVVARLNKDGSLDTSFGTASDGTPDGVVDYSLGAGNDYANALALQHDGKIVVAGSSNQSGSSNIEVLRLNHNGSVDTVFGTASDGSPDGVVNIDLGLGDDAGQAVTLQHDGKIVVAGSHFFGSSTDMVVARLNRDGSLDTGFGAANDGTPDGVVDISLGAGNDSANAVALQADGRIVVAGSSNQSGSSDVEVLRLLAASPERENHHGHGR